MEDNNCVLCDRPGYPTDYYAPNFEGSEPTAVIPLCQFHKGNYVAHGNKALDELWEEGKAPLWKWRKPFSSSRIGIIEFARDVLGLDLLPYQEEQLRRAEAGKLSRSVIFTGKPKRIMDEYRQFSKLGPTKWKARKEAL